MSYDKFKTDELILRDMLAIDRTLLANERTLLAYLRSAITLVIAGLTIMSLAAAGWFRILGICLIPAGVVSGGIGIIRYLIMDKRIRSILRES